MTRKRNVKKITKFKRSVRAISPVIATLLMIAIAVVASLVAYAFVMGYMGTTTAKVGHQIQIPSYTYDVSTGPSLLTVYVQNTGQGAVQLKQDGAVFANDVLVPILKADGVDVTTPAGQLITVNVGQTVSLLVNYTYTQGEYVKIKIITVDGTSMQTSGTPNQGGQGDSTQNEYTTQNEYALTVTAVCGSVAKSPDQTSYYSGDKVYLTATPDLGWSFSAWSPNVLSDAGGSYVAFGAADLGVTATFTQDQYTLTVNVVGDGCSVTKNPDQVSYTYGTSVTLTPVAASGWTFSGWNGDSTTGTVSMTGSKTVAASFTQNEYVLTVTAFGGSVARSPDQAYYHSGDKVYLTATADSGNSFSGWSANVLSDAGGSYVLFGAGDVAVTASFTQNSYAVSLVKVGSGTASMSGSSPYVYGAGVTLSASESVSGWTFAGWTTDNPSGIVITNGGSLSASAVITGAGTITATFTQNSYSIGVTVLPSVAAGTVTSNASAQIHYGDVVNFTWHASPGYSFSAWSLDGVNSGNDRIVTVTGNMLVTATFTQTQYKLTVNVVGSGSVIQTPDSASSLYDPGTVVQLEAVPANDYRLSQWSGALSGSNNFGSVTMDGDKTVTATFVSVSGQYKTSIDWWYHSPQVQQGATFNGLGFLNPGLSNRPIVLTFTAPDGSTMVDTSTVTISGIFQGFFWAQISIPQNAITGTWSVSAKFLGDSTYGASTADSISFQVSALPTYTVHFDATGVPLQSTAPVVTFHIGSGSDQQGIVPFDVQVAQGSTITYSYQNTVSQGATTQYVLTNTNPNPNPSSPQTITGPLSVTGSYKTQYQVAFSVNPAGTGSVTTPATTPQYYDSGTVSIPITASPSSGYAFLSWTCNPTGSVTFNNVNSASTTITKINAACTVTANFAAAPIVSVNPLGPITMDVGQQQQFTASASGGTGALSYKWYLDGVFVTGQTSSTYTYTAALPSGSHSIYVTVTDSSPVTVQSSPISVTVKSAPSISVQPQSATIDSGQQVTLSSTVTGGTGPFSWQWYHSGGGQVSSGSGTGTTATHVFSAADTGIYVVFTDTGTGSATPTKTATSNAISVTVNSALVAPTISTNSGRIRNTNDHADLTSTTVTTGTSPYTYQWLQKDPNAGTFSAISGATSNSYTFTHQSGTTHGVWSFELQVTDKTGAVVTSNAVTVQVG